jgi:membrane-associated PAP2 superfamily phosphatase
MNSFKSLWLLLLVGLFFLSVTITATEESQVLMNAKFEAVGQSWKTKMNQKDRCVFDVHNGYTVKVCG